MLTHKRGFLTFFKDLPSFRLIQELLLPPKIPLVTAQSPTSNLQLSAFTALPWQKSSATCNSVQNLKKKKELKKPRGISLAWEGSLGKSAWGMGRDFSSHFAECCLNPFLEKGGKMDKAMVEVTPDCRKDRWMELEPSEIWGAGGTLMLQQILQAGESTFEMEGLNLA